MKLSMYTCHAHDMFPHDFSAGLRHYRDLGVTGGVFLQFELKATPFETYCDLLEDAGLSLDGFVSTCNIAAFDDATREAEFETLSAQVDLAKKRGIPLVMIAPHVTEAKNDEELHLMREYMISSYNRIIESAGSVKIAIENYSLPTRADSKLSDLRYIFDRVPNLGFVLDTGNFHCVHEDARTAYEVLGDRMVQIHCKDWIYDENGWLNREGLPTINGVTLGEGFIPLSEILSRASLDHPDIPMILEDNSNNLTREGLDRSVEFLKQFVGGGDK